jgi:hypothetical protein
VVYGSGVDDDDIRQLVKRLSRPRKDGARVIERAAIMAAGVDADAVLAWVTEHGGEAEEATPTARRHGLHGDRLHDDGGTQARNPARFVIPAAALD